MHLTFEKANFKGRKSPGPDGLTPKFYLAFFDIIGDVLLSIFNEDNNNSTNVRNYRPISLLNTDRNFFSKITTTRMYVVLPSIISLSQTCSIRGRSIFDNVHLLRNIIDHCNQNELSAAFINLDQEKAFNRGCRLSPILYVLILEPFIRKIQNSSTIRGILVPGGDVEVKHMQMITQECFKSNQFG
ncbi:YTX2-like protein [Mya arenaria]|uniref:YTX2-like protein n=1 Tax=Mya arenaria TaxID=6604 RepID=A0ABY7E154_MYAAR|nr:YTX2-like protein [Mya arenaria]